MDDTNDFRDDNRRTAILAKLQQDIDLADDYYTKTIEPLVIERYEIFNSDKEYYRRKYPKLSKRCDIVSTDVQDTIESTMPALMKTFFGSTDVVTIQGMDGTPDDEQRAEKMQALINYQLERQHFFMTFYQWAKDALITNLGIIKIDWERTYKETQERITLLPEVYEQFAAQAQAQGVRILGVEYDPNGGVIVDYVTKVVDKNQPRIMNILASEFRYSPEATNLDNADFVAHRKIVNIDYLRKQAEAGLYDPRAVEELAAKDTTPDYTTLDKTNNENVDDESNQSDTGRRRVVLYECYVNINMTDDINAKLTPMIITVSSGVILRMEENTYERHPFFVLAPRIDPHKVWPKKGFVDLIAQIQHAKTAIIRQMIYNLALNNDSKLAVNSSMLLDINDVLEGTQVIRVNGDVKQAIQQIPNSDIQTWTFNMLEYLDMTKENRTGITRYNQGLDSNSLNKMLDINTPVPMADGTYKKLADIVDGDRIIGSSGKPVTVLKAHEIHNPEKAYNITFQSGEVICAGGEHLWTVRTEHGKRKVMDTDSMYEYTQTYKASLYVPRVGAVEFESDASLPVDPYLFGLYLGDGHRHACRITTTDREIVDYVTEWASHNGGRVEPCKTGQNAGQAATYTITGGLWSILHGLGIVKRTSGEEAVKYIPEEYFHAPYADRLALLQGLMDTDGCHHSGALCIFTQKEGRLLDDAVRLIASLGWNPSKHVTNPGEFAVEGVTYYNVHFSANENPFRLKRKKEKWEPRKRCRDFQSIVDIQPTSVRLMRCLTVDAEDGLFCVGERFTVTHNTATGINIITQASNQRLELIARIFAETGLRDMFKFLIKLNQLFVSQDTVIRLTNEPMQIKPDDLEGEFDLVINSGMGSGAKEQNLQDMQMLNSLMQQLVPAGFVGPKQIYNAAKKYIETIGFKNVDDFVMNPEEAMQFQQQTAMQAAQQNQPMSESLSVKWEQVPWQIQAQIIEKEGYSVKPEWFAEKAAEDVVKQAAIEQAKADAHKGEHDNEFRNNPGVAGAGGQGTQGGGGQARGGGVPPRNQG